MAIYELRCVRGHRFEVIQSFTAPLPACRECGAETGKVPSTFGFGGRASGALPPPPELMPQTWRGTYGADREYVTGLRRAAESRRALEERNPELAGDRRPVLAHEGRFEAAPLRAGDPLPLGGGHTYGHTHGHTHGHGHGHTHGHGHGHTHGQGHGGVAGAPAAGREGDSS